MTESAPSSRPAGRTGRAPARLGLTDPDAGTRLADLGWWDGDAPVEGTELAVWALARSPDPDLALLALERLRESLDDGEWAALAEALRGDQGLRGRLFGVLGGSTALGDHLVAHPERWRSLQSESTPGRTYDPSVLPDLAERTRTLLTAVGAEHGDAVPRATVLEPAGVGVLRLAYRDEVLALAAADLQSVCEPELPVVPVEVVAAQLADLASAGLRAALAVADATVADALATKDDRQPGDPLPCRLGVIGMGKCGGRELNYVSDIDVIFVCDGPTDVATRLASTMMRIATEAFLEVDANLRPEGRQGALVRTLDGHVSYYRRWAKTWEFQALLKARPVAGDEELAREYCEAVDPMVWSAADRDDFVADVRAMRRRVEDHIRADHADREIKLGRGGLRDVEFAVQMLQMVHGRGDDTIRSQNTLEALAALADGGTSVATTPPTSPRPTGSCGCSSTACSCRRCAAPTSSRPTTTPRACGGWPARPSCAPTAPATPWGCSSTSARGTRCACAGCTRSSSTARCWSRWPGCRVRTWCSPASRPTAGSRRWGGRRRRARWGTCRP